MKKIIIYVVKNFILAFILLYSFNLLLANLNIFVPINFYTIAISTLLGPFGVISLVTLSYVIT